MHYVIRLIFLVDIPDDISINLELDSLPPGQLDTILSNVEATLNSKSIIKSTNSEAFTQKNLSIVDKTSQDPETPSSLKSPLVRRKTVTQEYCI